MQKIILPHLSVREKIIALVLVVIVIGGGGFLFLIKPLWDRSQSLNEEIEAAQERIAKGRERISRSGDLEKQYQRLVSIWGEASSDAAESSDLVSKLEEAAGEGNVHIVNMEPQPVVKGVLVRYPVDLTIDGQWKGIVRFLYLLQAAPLSLYIESMELEKGADANTPLHGRITVSRLRVLK